MSEGMDIAEVTAEIKQDLVAVRRLLWRLKQSQRINVLQMVRQLNCLGSGIRQQCKLITDLTYKLELLDCGQYVLEELTSLYKYFYKNGQETWWVAATCAGTTCTSNLCSRRGPAGDTFGDDA